MQIVFAVSEVEDLVKTGGLADVGKSLPIALKAMGHDVCIVMPLYQAIEQKASLSDACVPLSFTASGQHYEFRVKQLSLHDVPVYLIDYPDYFARDGLYSDSYDAFEDNGQRFAFFCNATLHALSHLSIVPDVIHCNDWHTGMLPFLIRHNEQGNLTEEFAKTKTVMTIHNAAFQGVYEMNTVPILRDTPFIHNCVQNYYINYLQTGLSYCDGITSVSPNYAKELLTDLGSHGLSGILSHRANRLFGVLNGCDYTQWDPKTDHHIEANFDDADLTGKAKCKKALQKTAKLPQKKKVPMIGMVCRLTAQKGFGYIVPILEQLLEHKVQLVIVGTGDPVVVEQLEAISQKYSDKFAFIQGFSNEYAHWIEAGCDFFLMPSQFEPCGLNQMYSLAYGTLPIVRSVGGLKDTVIDAEADPTNATGFAFETPQPYALLACIRRALLMYHEAPEKIADIQLRAMQTKFTWQAAAKEYVDIYETIAEW